ncbi:MAG: hypothetical protein IK115_03465 [Lachnospiraceae bacterium]|nr:hypothetical protein [Lachnospiraceae bacterium]
MRKKTGMINFRSVKLIAAVLSVLTLLGGCQSSDIVPENFGMTQETEEESDAIIPHTKEDGSHYRLAYVDYDEYLPASRQLFYILKGLEESGWIKEGSLPFTIDDINKNDMSTQQMVETLWQTDLGEYIEFAEGTFFYLGYDDEAVIAETLTERAGKDVDLVITFGTSAGVFVKELGLPVPMVDFSATDPVASGIIDSATEGSGNPNVWAQVEQNLLLRQLKYYDSLKHFNRLGIIVYGDEIISGVPDIKRASEELGFELVMHHIDEQPRETKEELDAYYAMVRREFINIAKENIDAFFLTVDLVNDLDRLEDILQPLYMKAIPVYCMDDPETVRNGALMIISAYDFDNVGRFVADAIVKILDGQEAGSLPCTYTSAPSIYVNYTVAQLIHYPLEFDFLTACDKIYTTNAPR